MLMDNFYCELCRYKWGSPGCTDGNESLGKQCLRKGPGDTGLRKVEHESAVHQQPRGPTSSPVYSLGARIQLEIIQRRAKKMVNGLEGKLC